MNVIELTKALIACASVTPKDEGAQVLLAAALEKLGFECHHLQYEDVPNLFVRLGSDGPHLCYAGHTDVVPPGPSGEWTFGPFNPEIKDGVLFGRGASDMKGSVAAFVSAVSDYLEKSGPPKGSISLLITGDEEGPAVNGTIKVLEWMKENNHLPDVCLVGEPTNPSVLGQEIKIGRRGSLTGKIIIKGKQGHVAYQHLADNPLPRLAKMVDALTSHTFDEGSEFFAATNLEVTTIDVGNPTTNVIPGSGTTTFNIRFNDHWTGESLSDKIREILDKVHEDYELELASDSDSFITEPGAWTEAVLKAVEETTGNKAKYTTTGGTSDARFIKDYAPVAEFGLTGASMHKANEHVPVSDIHQLSEIYERVLALYFKEYEVAKRPIVHG